jgi:hypothetical protein
LSNGGREEQQNVTCSLLDLLTEKAQTLARKGREVNKIREVHNAL